MAVAAELDDAAELRMPQEPNAKVAKHTRIMDKRFMLCEFGYYFLFLFKLQIYEKKIYGNPQK
jgi:hypothetical protein